MIKDNIIYFGYGDVLVSSGYNLDITFIGIKPPVEIGSRPKSGTYEEIERVKLKIDFKDKHLLDKIKTREWEQVKLDGYILDFTNYNSESVRVVKDGINRTISASLRLMAC